MFGRKKGLMWARRSMSALSAEDRERGMDLLGGAEDVFVTLGAPSRLGTALISTLLTMSDLEDESQLFVQASGVALMGYATRMSQGLLPSIQAIAVAQREIPRLEDDEIDYERLGDEPDRFTPLLEYVATLADERDVICYLAKCSMEAWQAFSVAATMQFHQNLARNGMARRDLLPPGDVENLLAVGYALRVLDEAAGQEPLMKADIARER